MSLNIGGFIINTIKDNDKVPWFWYRGQFWVCESYKEQLISELYDLLSSLE